MIHEAKSTGRKKKNVALGEHVGKQKHHLPVLMSNNKFFLFFWNVRFYFNDKRAKLYEQ